AFIQSKPDGWKVSAEKIQSQTKDGLSSIKTSLKKLESVGLLMRDKFQNKDGHWEIEYILIEESFKIPTVEIPTSEIPTAVNHTNNSKTEFSKKDNSKKEIKEKVSFPEKYADSEMTKHFLTGIELSWQEWVIYKRQEFGFKFKSESSYKSGLKKLFNLSKGN